MLSLSSFIDILFYKNTALLAVKVKPGKGDKTRTGKYEMRVTHEKG
jgi:hypothetical protein